ncbi:MAG: transmembrane domain-containing protein [Chitinophagaceae bacterium]
MSITSTQLIISILVAVIIGGTLAFLFWRQRQGIKKNTPEQAPASPAKEGTLQMQLHAYERLILLTDRIALPNLISRVNQPGIGVKDMQMLLAHNIRQEFEHNVTQQIYVTAESWEAIRNLKDQNLLIVNQVASFMPAEATGQDLNRSILEMLVQNPKASLHSIVSDVLSYEAKKLMS